MYTTPAISLPLTEAEARALNASLNDDRPLLARLMSPLAVPITIRQKLYVALYNYRPVRNKL